MKFIKTFLIFLLTYLTLMNLVCGDVIFESHEEQDLNIITRTRKLTIPSKTQETNKDDENPDADRAVNISPIRKSGVVGRGGRQRQS